MRNEAKREIHLIQSLCKVIEKMTLSNKYVKALQMRSRPSNNLLKKVMYVYEEKLCEQYAGDKCIMILKSWIGLMPCE